MERKIIATAAFFGMTAVILGAFGAHKLKEMLAPEMLSAFETGVRYQMYHALFLLMVGLLPGMNSRAKKAIFWLASLGIVLFSGSIYLLSTSKISGVDFKSIGFVTPIGGLLLIVGWIVLMVNFLTKKS